MHRDNIALHYMFMHLHGKDFRILSTNLERLKPGNYSSDFFGFFGLGSGEFTAPRIKDFFHEVTTVKIKPEDIDTALFYWKQNPRFMGFVDRRPQEDFYVVLDGGKEQLHDLKFNWEVYTQLGVPEFARDTLGAFRRVHSAYETREENDARVDEFIKYVRLF